MYVYYNQSPKGFAKVIACYNNIKKYGSRSIENHSGMDIIV